MAEKRTRTEVLVTLALSALRGGNVEHAQQLLEQWLAEAEPSSRWLLDDHPALRAIDDQPDASESPRAQRQGLEDRRPRSEAGLSANFQCRCAVVVRDAEDVSPEQMRRAVSVDEGEER